MNADLSEDQDQAARLLDRMALQETAALREFYDTYHSRVYAFALRRLGNASDAAEILNEVMLEVWRRAAQFEGRSRPMTWVLGIAHHKVIDRLRRKRVPVDDDFVLDDLVDDAPATSDLISAAQDAEQLRRCLEQLSDAHRLVLHLAFYEDLPYPEIAEIAECPLGTVKTRVFHAKQLLKNCLGAAGVVS